MSLDTRPGKLIRDKLAARIPPAELRIATDPDELRGATAAKIGEEHAELAASGYRDPAEFADLMEAIEACAARHGVSIEAIAEARAAKRAERGAFETGLIWTPPAQPPASAYDQRPRLARLRAVLGDEVVETAAAAAGGTHAVDFGGWVDVEGLLVQGLASLRDHGAPLLQGLDDDGLAEEARDILRHAALHALAAACADAPPGRLAMAAARIVRTGAP